MFRRQVACQIRGFASSARVLRIDPPLKGLRVVDLTRILAGPYCTMLLADLGAEVIKIEHPTRGDDTRSWTPPHAPAIKNEEHPEWDDLPPESTYFLTVNRNKKSVGVNIKDAKGTQILHDLIEKADILVENYVPGKLKEMQLDYETLKKINPKLIYASISGYGQSGPFAGYPGYDVNIEAEAGLMSITGEPDGPPVKVGVAITDLTTGLYAHGAIMAALISRATSGKGCWIDCNLFDSQIASLANIASNFLITGQDGSRHGTSHPSIVPYQVLPTKDSYLMVAGGNDKQFAALSKALGLAHLPEEAKFKTNSLRVQNREELIQILTDALKKHTNAEWTELMTGKGFPFAPVNTVAETFSHPQAIARKVTTEIDHPRAGKITLLSPAVAYDGDKMEIYAPPPVKGQHTTEVLRDVLNYSQEDIDVLKTERII